MATVAPSLSSRTSFLRTAEDDLADAAGEQDRVSASQAVAAYRRMEKMAVSENGQEHGWHVSSMNGFACVDTHD
jgi:hypothetical protein